MAEIKDQFEQNLEQKTALLQECQRQKSLNSCFNCEQFFTCETRQNYIDAVYNSMSKGAQGGFEF